MPATDKQCAKATDTMNDMGTIGASGWWGGGGVPYDHMDSDEDTEDVDSRKQLETSVDRQWDAVHSLQCRISAERTELVGWQAALFDCSKEMRVRRGQEPSNGLSTSALCFCCPLRLSGAAQVTHRCSKTSTMRELLSWKSMPARHTRTNTRPR
jgi:hypothetical protein